MKCNFVLTNSGRATTAQGQLSAIFPRIKTTQSLAKTVAPPREAAMALVEELRRARIQRQDHKYFVPLSDLTRLITSSVIETEILDGGLTSPANIQACAGRTEKSAKKIFAILTFQKKVSAICSLLDHQLSDEALPFIQKRDSSSGLFSLWWREPEQRIQAFNDWGDDEVEEFGRLQWWVIPPVFNKDSLDCLELRDETILPFIDIKDHEKMDEGIPHMKIGGYSEVTAFRVHPAHHNFWDASIPLV